MDPKQSSGEYDQSHLRHLAEIYDYVAVVGDPGPFTAATLVLAKIPFRTVQYDPCNMWDPTLQAFRIPFTGLWRVEGAFRIEVTGGTYRYLLEAQINGSIANNQVGRRLCDVMHGGGYTGGTGGTSQNNGGAIRGNEEIYLREGDILELALAHTITSTRNYPVTTDPKDNHFQLRAVRRIELGEFPNIP